MTHRDHLNRYIHHLHQRLRLAATLREAALLALAALLCTLAAAAILNHYAFPERALTPARIVLLAALLLTLGAASIPLIRLTRRRAITRAEAHFPAFEQRLTTFSERQAANDPFLDLLAADTLQVAAEAPPANLIPATTLALFLAATVLATGLLTWLVKARPGALGYGASLLWTGPHHEIPPLYDIRVAPGDIAVRRNTDQIVTAQITGLDPAKVTLLARFASAPAWQRVPMQREPDTTGFQFLFAGLPEDVEYYVEAGPAASPHFHIRTVDLPAVKQIQVTYRYPRWTGMQTVSEDQAGDLRALEGTEADLTITMSAPLKDGLLALDGTQPIKLSGGQANKYRATIKMAKDGAYHVAALDNGQQVRLSEDYFLSTSKANPPTITIDRPTADYRASPIEEVRIGLKTAADFPLHHVALHYSVNGAPEQTVNVLKSPGVKNTDGATTLALEDFHLVPGDVVSLYATAADAHAEARTEISFVQIEPFEREFSQSQSGGGGGGGGGGQQPNSQTDIARREKELIAATWKQRNDKAATPQQAAATAKLLAEAQSKLRDQALALTARMESRDLSQANEEFNSFGKDMQTAAAAMVPSADKLSHQQWQDAMPIEQKALQALLRAEATFRKIEVAFGQKGGGGGGGGGSAGRDLASLFDLEMDIEKNQYETAQTGSAAEQQAKKVDDALAKLDALAHRQEELAQQQQTAQQTFQQRWQQEMLRREAEQLQREMEQMQAQQKGQQGQSGQQGQQGQSGQQSASNQSGQQGQSGSSQGGQSSSGSPSSQGSQSGKQSAANRANSPQADPLQRTVQQSLDRLRAANEEMRRAGASQGGQQQSAAEARRAAEQLREATNLLGGAQKQQATGKLDSLASEAARLAQQETAQADRIRALSSQSNGQGNGMELQTAQSYQGRAQQRTALAGDRQRLSDDLSHLQRNLRDTARQLAPNQPAASNSLRDALSAMDQEDLTNLTQRTADWLRRGINPKSNGTESQIAGGLKKLDDQIRQAQQATGSGQIPSQRPGKSLDSGTQMAALDHVDRLRSQLQALSAQGAKGRSGQQPGQPRTQQGSAGQDGQGQPGQQPGGSRQAQPRQPGGSQNGEQAGEIRQGGGGTTAANWNVNTGNNTYANGGPPTPSNTPNPADTQRTIRQGLNELNQLRALAKNDPAAQKEIDALAREMQRLDPSRFPGNPAMVEKLHTEVLAGVDKLELQLRHDDAADIPQVRATAPPLVPAGYQDAVADYFRRLGQTR